MLLLWVRAKAKEEAESGMKALGGASERWDVEGALWLGVARPGRATGTRGRIATTRRPASDGGRPLKTELNRPSEPREAA